MLKSAQLSQSEFARRYGVGSRHTVRMWIEKGYLRTTRKGRRLLIIQPTVQDLLDWERTNPKHPVYKAAKKRFLQALEKTLRKIAAQVLSAQNADLARHFARAGTAIYELFDMVKFAGLAQEDNRPLLPAGEILESTEKALEVLDSYIEALAAQEPAWVSMIRKFGGKEALKATLWEGLAMTQRALKDEGRRGLDLDDFRKVNPAQDWTARDMRIWEAILRLGLEAKAPGIAEEADVSQWIVYRSRAWRFFRITRAPALEQSRRAYASQHPRPSDSEFPKQNPYSRQRGWHSRK